MDVFRVNAKLDQALLLGIRTGTIEPLGGIKTVPDSSIYYPTHLLHQHLSLEPPKEFAASWITPILGDNILGKHLWSIDIECFHRIEELRQTLIAALENYLALTTRKSAFPERRRIFCRCFRTMISMAGSEHG
ncbi:MAG TPA: DUF5752 family protein [Terriglobales bacterium]|nr:DUF5752 family protein [Terriglobales bacterium]